jgi:hypothetical protein
MDDVAFTLIAVGVRLPVGLQPGWGPPTSVYPGLTTDSLIFDDAR